MEIYLDNSATTKVDNEVLEEMIAYLKENYGNPSSAYRLGRENRKQVEEARKRVAKALNAKENEIYFTSGGTESDNTALKGIAYANATKGRHIITSKIEHPAILESCKELERQGYRISYVNVDSKGRVNLRELESLIRRDTILISVMFANNEIGTIEPIKEIGEIAKKYRIPFHTDAVQAVGNTKIDVQELGIDLLALSSHKIYGPKGVGALYVREGINFRSFINGGHQEKGKRAGTENVPGIIGLGKAISIACNNNIEEKNNRIRNLRNYFIDEIMKNIPNVIINGDLENRLPGNINISIQGVNGINVLKELDEKEIYVSTGSACSTGNVAPSNVLTSIGLSNMMAYSTIRITLGKYNTKEEVDYTVKELKEIVTKLRYPTYYKGLKLN